MKKGLLTVLWVVFITLLLLGVPRLAAMVANLFEYGAIDPDGSWAWISVRHIVQALIVLVLIFVIKQFKPLQFGFSWGDKAAGKKHVLLFILFFTLYTAGAYATTILTNSFQHFQFPLTGGNIGGYLGFQLLLSGPSEELIFRAFAMTMLGLMVSGGLFKGKLSYANIIAAVIFGLAHMRFTFAPFEVTYIPFQVIFAFVLGLFYGICYEKTGSMYYPMIMHSYGNVLMVGLTVIFSFIL
ncbi:type II CAAX endopeptidase family protein [Aquisalimonas sp.]|uniref:CPBP family intramembrane glutamic endopeptidase n=1 Tax=Aquisalimonas sp. TaxID=1872621 RepID=UPI0025C5094A|nr:type II CAAX endopeptidase family protein [Aquisalimonas sp.]